MDCDLFFYADFQADFTRPATLDEPAGKELAAVLAEGLPPHGVAILKVEGIDFAYNIDCQIGASKFDLMVGAELGDESDRWFVQPAAKRSLFGRKSPNYADGRNLMVAVNEVLYGCEKISDIRWYPGFETQDYLALLPTSRGPIPAPDYVERLHPLIRLDWRLGRVNHLVGHPLSMILYFVLVIILAAVVPQFAAVIASILFFAAMAMLIVFPLVLSVFIGREGSRVLASRDQTARDQKG